MSDTPTLELARQLERMRVRLDELWLDPASRDARPEIDAQLQRIGAEMVRLISIRVQHHGRAYDDATLALRAANDRLTGSLQDVRNLDDALRAASRAVDLVALIGALAA